MLLLGFLGDRPTQWRLLCSQGKAVAFAAKPVALSTTTEVWLQEEGAGATVLLLPHYRRATSPLQGRYYQKGKTKQILFTLTVAGPPSLDGLLLPQLQCKISFGMTPGEDQKPRYLQQVQAVTANIRNKNIIQNSLQHTITVKNYIHTALPKKVPEDK